MILHFLFHEHGHLPEITQFSFQHGHAINEFDFSEAGDGAL
jgi:hypothetical protein